MTRKHEGSASWMTRREVLAQAALGAAVVAVSPDWSAVRAGGWSH